MSGAGPLVQNALGSMLEILKQEVFNATSVSSRFFLSRILCTSFAILLRVNTAPFLLKVFQPLFAVAGEGGGVGLRPPTDQAWQRRPA